MAKEPITLYFCIPHIIFRVIFSMQLFACSLLFITNSKKHLYIWHLLLQVKSSFILLTARSEEEIPKTFLNLSGNAFPKDNGKKHPQEHINVGKERFLSREPESEPEPRTEHTVKNRKFHGMGSLNLLSTNECQRIITILHNQ